MADTLPPDLRESAQAAHIALTCISTHPTLDMSDYLRGRVDAAAAGLEAALAAVPARTLTDEQIDHLIQRQWATDYQQPLYPAARAFARAVLAAAPQAVPVPANMALVPVEPTQEMRRAMLPDSILPAYVGAAEKALATFATRYRAMLAAAPKEQP